MAQEYVAWFWAIECNVPGQPHLHILLGGTKRLTCRQIARAWKLGFTRVTVLGSRKAAIRYTVKNLGTYTDNYDISRRLIPIE